MPHSVEELPAAPFAITREWIPLGLLVLLVAMTGRALYYRSARGYFYDELVTANNKLDDSELRAQVQSERYASLLSAHSELSVAVPFQTPSGWKEFKAHGGEYALNYPPTWNLVSSDEHGAVLDTGSTQLSHIPMLTVKIGSLENHVPPFAVSGKVPAMPDKQLAALVEQSMYPGIAGYAVLGSQLASFRKSYQGSDATVYTATTVHAGQTYDLSLVHSQDTTDFTQTADTVRASFHFLK